MMNDVYMDKSVKKRKIDIQNQGLEIIEGSKTD
jgi:hypothetical protein